MEKLIPFVGAIVNFNPGGDEPRPAIVTLVHSDDCVNLVVFRDATLDYGAGTAAEMRSSIYRGDEAGQWSYPSIVIE